MILALLITAAVALAIIVDEMDSRSNEHMLKVL